MTDLPKVVQLQSIELAATYAGHFPALGKQAFTQVMALQESGDASVKAMALKSLPGFLKPAIKTNEAGEKFNSNTLVSEGAPSLLQKKFEAADEASVKMATELLNKVCSILFLPYPQGDFLNPGKPRQNVLFFFWKKSKTMEMWTEDFHSTNLFFCKAGCSPYLAVIRMHGNMYGGVLQNA